MPKRSYTITSQHPPGDDEEYFERPNTWWKRTVIAPLNKLGFYALGVCKGRDVRQWRSTLGWRVDVLGYLFLLNILEILGNIQTTFGVPQNHLALGALACKISVAASLLVLYLQTSWRSNLDIYSGDVLMTSLIVVSGATSAAVVTSADVSIPVQTAFGNKYDDVDFVDQNPRNAQLRLGQLCLSFVGTLGLCLLPGFGRSSLFPTLAACWSLTSINTLCGLVFVYNSQVALSSALLFAAILVFCANLICTCKHMLFINKEDIMRFVTGEALAPPPGKLAEANGNGRAQARPNRRTVQWNPSTNLPRYDSSTGTAVEELKNLLDVLDPVDMPDLHKRLEQIITRLETSRASERNPWRNNHIQFLTQNLSVPSHAMRFFTIEMAGGRELLLLRQQRSFRTGRRESVSNVRYSRPSDGILNSSVLNSILRVSSPHNFERPLSPAPRTDATEGSEETELSHRGSLGGEFEFEDSHCLQSADEADTSDQSETGTSASATGDGTYEIGKHDRTIFSSDFQRSERGSSSESEQPPDSKQSESETEDIGRPGLRLSRHLSLSYDHISSSAVTGAGSNCNNPHNIVTKNKRGSSLDCTTSNQFEGKRISSGGASSNASCPAKHSEPEHHDEEYMMMNGNASANNNHRSSSGLSKFNGLSRHNSGTSKTALHTTCSGNSWSWRDATTSGACAMAAASAAGSGSIGSPLPAPPSKFGMVMCSGKTKEDVSVDKNGRLRLQSMQRWGLSNKNSMYMRRYMQEWDFGPGGFFARLKDPMMPRCFGVQPLTTTFMEAVMMFDCATELGLDNDESQRKMIQFMDKIERSYLPRDQVAYHNSWHATDVLQSCVALLSADEVRGSLLYRDLSTFAILFSAAIHDVAHPGRNQSFLVKTQSDLAIVYSDRSVLEHHHLAVAFGFLRQPELNFMEDVNNADWALFRERVILMVLGTDLAVHIEHMEMLKELVNSTRPLSRACLPDTIPPEVLNDPSANMQTVLEADLNIIMCSIVHVADVGNTAKSWNIYRQWIPLVFQEFFDQGDQERSLGLEVAKGYDREVCFPCEMQTYFFDIVVESFIDTLAQWSPAIGRMLVPNLEENKIKLREYQHCRINELAWPSPCVSIPSPASSASLTSSSPTCSISPPTPPPSSNSRSKSVTQ